MIQRPVITEDDIRSCIVERAEALSTQTGMSISAIGIAAVGDSKFLARVKSGRGFNVKTYQRALDWIEGYFIAEASE